MMRRNQTENSGGSFGTLFMDQGNSSCLLDENHVIVATNGAWDAFARDNGISPDYSFVGISHLQVCLTAGRQGDRYAQEAVVMLLAVSSGDLCDAVSNPYPCHKVLPGEPVVERWFRLRVRSLMPKAPLLVVTHERCDEPVTQALGGGIGISLGTSTVGGQYSM